MRHQDTFRNWLESYSGGVANQAGLIIVDNSKDSSVTEQLWLELKPIMNYNN